MTDLLTAIATGLAAMLALAIVGALGGALMGWIDSSHKRHMAATWAAIVFCVLVLAFALGSVVLGAAGQR